MSRIYSPFNAGAIGPDLATERGDTVVFTTEDGTDSHRRAVSLFGQSGYISDVEFLFWSTAPPTEGGGLIGGGGGEIGGGDSPTEIGDYIVYVGIAKAGEVMTKAVGHTADSFGLRADTGDVYNNGSIIATFDTFAFNDTIRVNLDVPALVCRVYKNNTLLGSFAIPSGHTWHYAVTVAGGNAGELKCYANAGQQLLQSPDQTTDGWWQALPQIPPLRLATDPYLSSTNERFVQGLSRSGGVRNNRAIAFWPDADSGGTSDVGTLEIVDREYTILPTLLGNDVRDLPVDVLLVDTRTDAQETAAVGVVESVEASGDTSGSVVLRDRMAQFDAPMQRRLVPPNAEDSSVDRPWPALIGAARSIPLLLLNQDAREYAVSDAAIGNLGLTRANGFPVDPADVVLSYDGQRVTLAADLQGRVTIDASANGQFFPGTYTDVLVAAGRFDAMTSTSDLIATWTRGGGRTATFDNPVYYPQWADYGNSIGRVEFIGSSDSSAVESWIATPTNVIQAGRTYRAKVFIEYIPGIDDDDGSRGFLILTGRPSVNGAITEWKRWQNDATMQSGIYADSGENEAVFHNAESVDLPFAIQTSMSDNVRARVRWVELYELPAAGDDIPLGGTTLQEFCRGVIEQRAGLPASTWRSDDAKAIDVATGYEYGTHISDTLTTRQVVDMALKSATACLAPRADGSAGIVRLIAPEDVDDGDVDYWIEASDLIAEPTTRMDTAQGLSTRAKCRKNIEPASPSDFGDDFDPGTGVPNALRKVLSADYQITVVSAVQLAPCYAHALSGEALPTIFDKRAHAQAEIDRVCTIYATQRYFRTLSLHWTPEHRFEAGQVIALRYSPNSAGTWQKYQIRSVEEIALDTINLTVWG